MGAGIGGANIKKTIYYLQRNGVRKTWNAVRERLEARNAPPYVWMPPSKEELERQRGQWRGFPSPSASWFPPIEPERSIFWRWQDPC